MMLSTHVLRLCALLLALFAAPITSIITEWDTVVDWVTITVVDPAPSSSKSTFVTQISSSVSSSSLSPSSTSSESSTVLSSSTSLGLSSSSLLPLSSASASSSTLSSLSSSVPAPTDLAKTDDGPNFFVITGAKTGSNQQTGARPARRNILDLQNDTPAWSLYIQALAAMQNADDSDPLSYFQVAGIHGYPYLPWNNYNTVPGAGPANGIWGGYCTHNAILFPTWHRPYLALIEQVIGGHAQNIAKNYTGSSSSVYQTAADNLRIPYWDWATIPTMPDVVSQPKVQITTPSGVQQVDNPLYSYKFHKVPSQNGNLFPGGGLADSPATWRSDTANQALQNGNLMNRAWSVLAKSTDYNSFATSASTGTSLETVHNEVHGAVGGSGHMSYLAYSAFDPIFWLHHTNIDRFFALWQAANPSTYMTTPMSEPGTFALVRGSNDTIATPLAPFASNQFGQPYNSMSARYLSYFDYTYPEIDDWSQNPDQLKANVSAKIYSLYDPDHTFVKRRDIMPRKVVTPGTKTKEWTVDVGVNKFDLDGSGFWLRFFVGDVPADAKSWMDNKACAGSVHVMGPPFAGEGPEPVLMEYDELSLDAEVAKAGLDPLDLHAVARFLGQQLTWRVQKLDGTVVPTEQLKSLSVAVGEQTVEFPFVMTELPTYGKKTVHPDATEGKPGGCGCVKSS